MGRKTNSKRSRLIALFAVILAAVGALVLMPKPAVAAGETTGTLTIKKVSTNTQASFDLDITIDGDTTGVTYKIDGGESKSWTDRPTSIQNGQTIEISGIPFASGEQENLTVKETSSGYNTYATYGMAASAADIAENLANFTDNTFRGGIVQETPYASLTIYNMVPTIETQVSPSEITPKSEGYTETITDNVKVTGLVPGFKYTVEGKLMQDGTEVATATVSDATADSEGNLDVTPEYKDVPVGKYAGKKLVAYATVKDGNSVVIEHKDDKDAKQTVTINEIPPIGSLSITKTLKTPIIDGHIENPTGETDEDKAADKKKWETRKEKAQNQLGENKAVFLFKVDLTGADGKTLEGEFKYTGAAEGTLKSGDSIGIPVTKIDEAATITIEGLPEGASYTVTETTAEGYVLKDKKSDTGKIVKGETAAADFTNAPLGSLKIIKNIKITAFDAEIELYDKAIEEAQKEMDATTDQSLRDAYQIVIDEANKYKEEIEKKKAELAATEFTFTVTLTDADKKALTETKEYKTVTTNGDTGTEGTIKFEDGKSATVKLKGGEYITVIGMDPEYNVSVAETPVDGWTANHKSLSGTVIEGVPLTATFENTYNGTDTTTPTSNTPSSGSTTKSSTKLANTADPVVDAVLIAAAGAPVALSGLALRRRK